MALRFNPPPNWPTPPEGFIPDKGWMPDPAWGPAPEGWEFWVEAEQDAAVPPAHKPVISDQPASPKDTSKNTYLWGGSLATVLVVGLIATMTLIGSPNLDEGTPTAAESSPSAESTAYAVPTQQSYSSPSASPTDPGLSTLSITPEKAAKVYDAATEVPEPQEFPAGSFREYTSDQVEKPTSEQNGSTERYVFEFDRVPDSKDSMAWVELHVTVPSTEENALGTFSAYSRDISDGEPKVFPFDASSLLRWQAGDPREKISTYWIPSHQGKLRDKMDILVPTGSTWVVRIHPIDHAPILSGAVKADGSQAFRYRPGAKTLYTISPAQKDRSTNTARVNLFSSPTAQAFNERKTMANSEFTGGYGEAYLKGFSLTEAGLDDRDTVYINAFSSSYPWVVSDTAP